jgi:hypothetical protein
MSDGRATAASEMLVAVVQERLNSSGKLAKDVKLLHGAALVKRLESLYISAREYDGEEGVVRLAQYIDCDFVIHGEYRIERSSGGLSVVGTWRGFRPGEDASSSSAEYELASRSDFRTKLEEAHERPPSVRFGTDAREVVFDQAAQGRALAQMLDAAVDEFAAKVRAAKAVGRVGADLGDRKILLRTPTKRDTAYSSKFSEAVHTKLRDKAPNCVDLPLLDEQLREKRRPGLLCYWNSFDEGAVDALDCEGVVLTSYHHDEIFGSIELSFVFLDRLGRTEQHRTAIPATARVNPARRLMDEPGGFVPMHCDFNGEDLLIKELEEGVDELARLAVRDGKDVLKGKTLRILPVVTPATKDYFEFWHRANLQLVQAKAAIRKRTLAAGTSFEDALENKAGAEDFKVQVENGSNPLKFGSWNEAHRKLTMLHWTDCQRAQSMAKSSDWSSYLAHILAEKGAVVHNSPAISGNIEQYGTSYDDLSRGGKLKKLEDLDVRLGEVPELLVVVEVVFVGTKARLRFSLLKEEDVSKPLCQSRDRVLGGQVAEAVRKAVFPVERKTAPATPKCVVRLEHAGANSNPVANELRHALSSLDRFTTDTPTQAADADELAFGLVLRYPIARRAAAEELAQVLANPSMLDIDVLTRVALQRHPVKLELIDGGKASKDDAAPLVLRLRL